MHFEKFPVKTSKNESAEVSSTFLSQEGHDITHPDKEIHSLYQY